MSFSDNNISYFMEFSEALIQFDCNNRNIQFLFLSVYLIPNLCLLVFYFKASSVSLLPPVVIKLFSLSSENKSRGYKLVFPSLPEIA